MSDTIEIQRLRAEIERLRVVESVANRILSVWDALPACSAAGQDAAMHEPAFGGLRADLADAIAGCGAMRLRADWIGAQIAGDYGAANEIAARYEAAFGRPVLSGLHVGCSDA